MIPVRIQLSVDHFPMLLLDSLERELAAQGICAEFVTEAPDIVTITTTVGDVVKAQVFVILCDKYHFGG